MSLASLRPGLPRPVASTIERALSADPFKRFTDAASYGSNGVWTVIVLTNGDPPAAETVGRAIMQALGR